MLIYLKRQKRGEMVNSTIINYLKEGLKKGYSLNSLKESLLKQGYSSSDVDDAAKEAIGKKEIKLRTPKYAVLLLVMLAVIIGAYFGIKILGPTAPKGLSPEGKRLWQELLNYTDYSLDYYYLNIAVAFAVKNNNFLICEVLRNQRLKDRCFFNVVTALGDIAPCDKIQDPGFKMSCYQFVSVESNKPQVCEEFDEESDRDICYTNFALMKNDRSICEKASGDWLNICNAALSKDITYCEKIVNQNLRWFCIAALTNDISACEKVGYENYMINKDECYFSVGEREENETFEKNLSIRDISEYTKEVIFGNQSL